MRHTASKNVYNITIPLVRVDSSIY